MVKHIQYIPILYLIIYKCMPNVIRVKLWLKTNDWIGHLCSFISRLKIFSFIRNGRLRHFGLSGFKIFLLKTNLFKGHFFSVTMYVFKCVWINPDLNCDQEKIVFWNVDWFCRQKRQKTSLFPNNERQRILTIRTDLN